jgi:CxxC motif-containing protein (DUF1111 family)
VAAARGQATRGGATRAAEPLGEALRAAATCARPTRGAPLGGAIAVALLLTANLGLHDAAAQGAPDGPQGEQTAGAATVFATGRNAFSFPLATLDDAERTRFAVGNSFFRRNWVEAPSSTQARDGLGPHFIARSCGGCHDQDGRGAPPAVHNGRQDDAVGLLLRLSIPGADARRGVVPDPVYGDQLANAAVGGVQPEGQLRITHTPVRGRFADGTAWTLLQPRYRVEALAYGPLSPGVLSSPRVAPHLAGVGLLEAIPEAEILHNMQLQAALQGPIKGRVNRVWDDFAQAERIGRFGWKANVATLAHQTAGAFHGDMGITSSVHPQQTCTPVQQDCLAAPSGGTPGAPEIDDRTLGDVVFYTATLGPPARRGADDPRVQRGAALFAQSQCAVCHRPGYVTGAPPDPTLSTPKVQGLPIWPYTDLLLHDMGPALADGRPDFQANGRQWKTPPLWGLGLLRDVNRHQRLMHDGRADGVLEAILWHGGEAEAARQAVLKMPRADREALVLFVESL